MDTPEGLHEEVYRGHYAMPFAVGVAALGAFVIWDTVNRGEGRVVRVVVGGVVFVLAYVYALAYRPAVTLDRDRVRLLNVLRDVAVPWSQVAGVRTRWSLVVDTDDGRAFPSWAISSGRPRANLSPGRSGADPMRVRVDGPKAMSYADTVRQAVVRRREAWRVSGRRPSAAAVEVAWAWPSIAAMGLGTAVLAVAVLW